MKISCPSCGQHYEIDGPGSYQCTRCSVMMKVPASAPAASTKIVISAPSKPGRPLEYYILKIAGVLIIAAGIFATIGMAKAGGAVALAVVPFCFVGLIVVGALLSAAATALAYLQDIQHHTLNN